MAVFKSPRDYCSISLCYSLDINHCRESFEAVEGNFLLRNVSVQYTRIMCSKNDTVTR